MDAGDGAFTSTRGLPFATTRLLEPSFFAPRKQTTNHHSIRMTPARPPPARHSITLFRNPKLTSTQSLGPRINFGSRNTPPRRLRVDPGAPHHLLTPEWVKSPTRCLCFPRADSFRPHPIVLDTFTRWHGQRRRPRPGAVVGTSPESGRPSSREPTARPRRLQKPPGRLADRPSGPPTPPRDSFQRGSNPLSTLPR